MFTSYAQNFEDVILWRALGHVNMGFYIDVGAQDPIVESVSLAFYEQGWRGVHVEALPVYAEKLRTERSDECVIQAAVADCDHTISFFEVVGTGLSTGRDDIADRHRGAGFDVREVHVPCVRLSDLFDRYKSREIHWLKIDVEGMEADVIRTWGQSSARPWVVVVESTLPNSQQENFSSWEAYILDRGYDFVYFDGLNRFYLSHLHLELKCHFGAGPNIFDDFAVARNSWLARGILPGLHAAEQERDAAVQGRDAAVQGRDAAVQGRDAAVQGRDAAVQECERLSAALLDHREAIASLGASLEAREQEKAELASERHRLGMAVEHYRDEIARIRASKSWLVTAPLRRGQIAAVRLRTTAFTWKARLLRRLRLVMARMRRVHSVELIVDPDPIALAVWRKLLRRRF